MLCTIVVIFKREKKNDRSQFLGARLFSSFSFSQRVWGVWAFDWFNIWASSANQQKANKRKAISFFLNIFISRLSHSLAEFSQKNHRGNFQWFCFYIFSQGQILMTSWNVKTYLNIQTVDYHSLSLSLSRNYIFLYFNSLNKWHSIYKWKI